MCATVDVQTVDPAALWDVKSCSLHSVIAWKDKTLKNQYLIHEVCTGLPVKPNMFVSNDTFKIGKALHIYIAIQMQHCSNMEGNIKKRWAGISLTRVPPGSK